MRASNPIPASYAVAIQSGTGIIQSLHKIGDDKWDVHIPLQTITIQTDNPKSVLVLKWNNMEKSMLGETPRLRLATASGLKSFQDIVVTMPNGELIGTLEISMTTHFQIFELAIPENKIEAVLESGVEVRLTGKGSPISFFVPGENVSDALCPHLLLPGTVSPREEFLRRITSNAFLSDFGWQAACEFDGLAALAATAKSPEPFKTALQNLLEIYLPEGSSLRVYPSIENTACIAQLAIRNPTHPEIESTLAFWKNHETEPGVVAEINQIAAEGNYSVCWPLATLAALLDRPELAENAIAGLRIRTKYLVDEKGAIWLRYRFDTEPLRTFKLWGRGITWYFLGMAKTMNVLPNVPDDIISEFKRTAEYLANLQDNEGMWHMFADDSDTAPESSGTAGIAAAMAIGVRSGWLSSDYITIAQRALSALDARLTPDGFLTGVAHCNKWEGGEEFQRRTKGTILQFGMGFYAQLLAELAPFT